MGSGGLAFKSVRLLDGSGEARHIFGHGDEFTLELQLEASLPLESVVLGITIEGPDLAVWNWLSSNRDRLFNVPAGLSSIRVRMPKLILHAGNYFLSLGLMSNDENPIVYDAHVKMYTFTVSEPAPSFGYSARLARLPVAVSWSD